MSKSEEVDAISPWRRISGCAGRGACRPFDTDPTGLTGRSWRRRVPRDQILAMLEITGDDIAALNDDDVRTLVGLVISSKPFDRSSVLTTFGLTF